MPIAQLTKLSTIGSENHSAAQSRLLQSLLEQEEITLFYLVIIFLIAMMPPACNPS
jgi:hypothetical protein